MKRMQERALKQQFDKLDGDNSGTLEDGEIRELMESLGADHALLALDKGAQQLPLILELLWLLIPSVLCNGGVARCRRLQASR